MKIAILEDNKERLASMRGCLADRFYQYEAHFFDNSVAMMRFLEEHLADTLVISLDHDLDLESGPNGRCIDPGTGREVAEFLAGKPPTCPVILATSNSIGAAGMKAVLREAGWKTCSIVPLDDTHWIETDWFNAIRRSIVGPLAGKKGRKSRS